MNGRSSGFLFAMAMFASPAIGATIYSQTQSGSVVFGDSTPVVLTFTGTPEPGADATLSLIATGGELANNNKRLEQLTVDGDTYQSSGQPAGWVLPVNFLDGSLNSVDPVTIPQLDLAGYAADGQITVSVVRPNFIAGGVFDITLEYRSAIPEPTSAWLAGSMAFAVSRRRRP